LKIFRVYPNSDEHENGCGKSPYSFYKYKNKCGIEMDMEMDICVSE
jgi:hypothetical protein